MRPWISSQMIQSLPGFLDLSLNVCSPSRVLWDFYTEVLEAAHPLHRGPTDHKRSVGPLLCLPEVYDQLLSFAHVKRETVVLAPWCKSLYLIQVCGLIIVENEAQNHSIISKFDNRSGSVRGHAVMCVEAQGFTENGPKKRKYPVSGSCVDKNALLMSEVRGEWADWLEMIERQQ